ncbi:hypothetical protein [Streptomyces piniterrae]|uniref:hypothetical protein n=1 Tax=Streptomyces piniterrae TaxID=2571125 RepID=UPI0016522590|nr:hypothetical protein [Streptomyces piniterrae]
MTDRTDDTPAPQRHPELLEWLSKRSSAFEHWARATGTPELWDFSPTSLDALEDLLRRTYTSDEEVSEERCGEFVQGAVWYVGEVACRSSGVVWRYEPFACDGEPLPSLFAETYAAGSVDTPCVSPTGDCTEDRLYVMAAIYRLFLTHDEVDNPIDERLCDVPYDCDRYQRLAEWLQARAAGFEEWARETGRAETESWDFSPESLDTLEELVRGRYGSEEELNEEREGLFVQGAVWYIGEVIRRSTDETSWGYAPFYIEGTGDFSNHMFVPGADDELDTPYLSQPHFQEEDFVYPMNHLTLLFWKESVKYYGQEAHLRDAFDDFE